jgi:hypothetical protein
MELTKEDFALLNAVLLKAKDMSETAGFDMEKLFIDSYGIAQNELGSSMIQQLYEQLLYKIEDSVRRMGVSDENNPAIPKIDQCNDC